MERTVPPVNSHASFDTREKFQVHDNTLNQTIPTRDCTDDQLGRALAAVQAAWKQSLTELSAAVTKAGAMQATLAIIEFEIDRRRRTLTIAKEIPRS